MIVYTEKGKELHATITATGHSLVNVDGVWSSDDDVAVQAIIDSFDAVGNAKTNKITELKTEGLRRANLIYDPDDKVFPNIAAIELLIDINATYTKSGALATRLISVRDILTAAKNARTAINALSALKAVETYDVVVTPAWP